MTISLSVFLYIYLAFLVVWAVFFIIAIYHMLRFGFRNSATVMITLLFITVALVLTATSLYFINGIDWSETVSLTGRETNTLPDLGL